MADSRYGSSGVNTANVQQFVMGLQARNQQALKDSAKAFGVGLLTAAAVALYTDRRGWKR